MDQQFWLDKWTNQQIGFHLTEVNAFLSRHYDQLQLRPSATVFVPLCGKSLDIHWLLAQGHRVIGIDLSEIAIVALLDHLGLDYRRQILDDLIHFQAAQLDLFVGDLFALKPQHLAQMQIEIDAIYDRAALVALPAQLRPRYVEHLITLGNHCQQLLINYDYPQASFAGPPFAVADAEIRQLYQHGYRNITLLEQLQLIDDALAQRVAGQAIFEKVWLINNPKPSIIDRLDA